MEIKRYFEELHNKLRQVKKDYAKGLITGQVFEQELKALIKTSETILEEWIRFEEALSRLEPPCEPGAAMKEWKQGEAFYLLMMYHQAIPLLEKVVAKFPEFDLARLFLAHSYLAVQRLDEAKYHLQLLLNTATSKDVYHLAANGLACLEGSLKAYDLAHHYFQKIDLHQVKKEWRGPIVYNHALTLYQLGDFALSQEKWKMYIRLAPRDWRGFFWLGKTYQQQDRGDEASVCWMEALQIEEHPQLIKHLARFYEEKEMYQVALHYYQRLFGADGRSKDKETWVGMAWNLGLGRKMEQSRLHFLKAISLFPKEQSIPFAYAWMLLYWNQKEEARYLIAKLEKLFPLHPLLIGLKALLQGRPALFEAGFEPGQGEYMKHRHKNEMIEQKDG